MNEDYSWSDSIFVRLLTSIIKEKLNVKLGANYLKENFPNFTLNTYIPTHNLIVQKNKRDKVRLDEEVEFEYYVLINFNVFDDIKTFGNIVRGLDDNYIPTYEKIVQGVDATIEFSNLSRYAEHIVWQKKKTNQWPLFKFKQGRYLETIQEKIDFYFNGFINSSYGKLFNSDPEIASFSLFPELILGKNDAKEFKLPLNLIRLLKRDPNQGFTSEINNFLKNYFELRRILRNNFGNSKYSFITNLAINSSRFVQAYETNEILNNSKLLTAFGDPTLINNGGYTKAVLVYDVDLSLANNQIISKNSHKERVYIFVYFDENDTI